MRIGITATVIACSACLSTAAALRAADRPRAAASTRVAAATRPAPATKPADMPQTAWAGLRYLGQNQDPSGGWGQFTVKQMSRNFQAPKLGGRPAAWNAIPPPPPYFPPNIAETAAVLLAFVDGGPATSTGEAAAPLAKAIEHLRHQALSIEVSREDAPKSGLVERCQITRTMLNPHVDDALALEALITYRQRLGIPIPDPLTRGDYHTLLARLKTNQLTDGSWPLDPKVNAVLEHNAAGLAKDLAEGLGAHDFYKTFPKPVPILGDALITRALIVAARAGVTTDAFVLDRARAHLLEFYDPLTGDVGGEPEGSFYRTAAVLNLLYQDVHDAPPAKADARRAALDRARGRFFEKLRAVNAPGLAATRPTAAAPRKPQNPLDTPAARRPTGNPLDLDKPRHAATTGPATQPYRVPVPISTVDVAAYFLLLESLQGSTHPGARELSDDLRGTIGRAALKAPVVMTYARDVTSSVRVKDGWFDPNVHHALEFHWVFLGGRDSDNFHPVSSNHLLTALAVRTLLLPAPPEPAK